jgi:hypothetical protein
LRPQPPSAFPAKAGTQTVSSGLQSTHWIPPREGGDCAGKAVEGESGMSVSAEVVTGRRRVIDDL